jgi:hypothetical protein
MPERVSKEERVISMTIEKARKVKELLRESMEGNRLPDEKDDRMEKVKVKRPKAEKDKTKMENNTGTHSGYGKAGEMTQFKKSEIKKSYLRYNQADNTYSLSMNKGGAPTYTNDNIQFGLNSLGLTLSQAQQNSQSAEHLEMFLNRNNSRYSIPQQNIKNILNKKYGLNL